VNVARRILVIALLALVATFACWFSRRGEWVALAVFALPQAWLALMVWRGLGRASFWSGLLALLWFSHGVMVAWTRPPERGYALVEVALSLAIVFAASLPGLRARFGKRKQPDQ
jgi:uncharacterized membrane protein